MLDKKSLDNPKIKVVWEDVAESFTQERIARIKSYFAKKYKSRNVTVVTKTIVSKDNRKLDSIDMADNILDTQYQKELIKDYVKQHEIDVEWDLISRLDDRVNNEIDKSQQNTIRFRQWYIKRLEFSNFLSYGDGNIVDFDKLGGITCIESDPPNFGGKTVLAVDLMMFLFFNQTTKTKKNEEIFNQFTTKDDVHVRGDVVIDGDEYVIVRNIKRKPKRAGGYTVSSSLEFIKKMPDDSMVNLSGEQRRETEEFIKSAIGTQDDFLTTILTTGGNLEELIDSKPTALGQVFTKFIGLEALKEKEDVAKKIYSDWNKSLISNIYNVEDIKTSISESEDIIKENKDLIKVNELKLKEKEIELKGLIDKKDLLISKKHTDIDEELIKLNPSRYLKEIQEFEDKVTVTRHYFEEINVTEPEEYYNGDEHQKLRDEISHFKAQQTILSSDIDSLKELITQLKEGEICPTCKRALDDVDHTEEIKEKENKLKESNKKLKNIGKSLDTLVESDTKQSTLKVQFENYDRDKLRKEKYRLELKEKEMELKDMKAVMDKWESNKHKLEENMEIEKDIVVTKTKIDSSSADVDQVKYDIQNSKNIISNHEDKIVSDKEKIDKITKEEDYKKVFEAFLAIFGKHGISKMILRSMIPVINSELSRLLEDSSRFTLDVRISDKNEVEFIMIDDETRVEKPMSSGSGYERTIASMALRAVLSKVSALPKPNVIVMDEVFGKVADDNLEMVGSFFRKIKSYFEHIFVITHNPLVKNWSDHVVTINKNDNVSSIKNIS
jgi:DNA repair exonuclease SbcCD ATPase subunit